MREHKSVKVLTKHARKRFIERVGYLTDEEMLWYASIPNKQFRFIWKWSRTWVKKRGKRFLLVERKLVTVIERPQKAKSAGGSK